MIVPKRSETVHRLMVVLGILFFFGFFMAVEVAYGYGWRRYQNAREQPIAFSHKLHVGKQNIPCTTCHLFVEKSRHAGVPFVETCMQCHQNVLVAGPQVDRLLEHRRKREPIEWARIYRLPDFIYFSHKRHVQANVDCADCHGQVEWMETMRRVSSLKMGWCVSCHKTKGAPRDCWTCHK